MQTAHSFSMSNFTSASYTPMGNSRAYTHASGNYQASYTTVAYTDTILLPGSLLGFLPNHGYQNASWFNAYGQQEVDGFGYETPAQFPFRPGTNPNNLTNQLTTILRESFDIEPKGRRRIYQKLYPDYYDQLPFSGGNRVPVFSKFSGDDGKTTLELECQFIL
jgi:hypothetical protein